MPNSKIHYWKLSFSLLTKIIDICLNKTLVIKLKPGKTCVKLTIPLFKYHMITKQAKHFDLMTMWLITIAV